MSSSIHFHQALAITNDLSWLAQVRDLIQRGVVEGHFPEQFLNRLQIAVDEAVTNIIEHGYADVPRGTAPLEVVVDVNHERYRVEIIDQGLSFDPGGAAEVDIVAHVAQGKSGGLGIFLMRRIMDQVDYHYRAGKRNQLTLVKFRK
jgi:anti-sigma regulatory factor (Ser/Thr protein kinase)